MPLADRVSAWSPAHPTPLTAWEALQVITRLYEEKNVEGLATLAVYLGEDLARVYELAARLADVAPVTGDHYAPR